MKYIDELGGMNIFFVYDNGTVVTPPLTGTILPGITRDSVITLARAAGHTVRERPISFDEWRTKTESGKIREAFACGTAAVITPIGTVRYAGGEFTMPSGADGEVTTSLRQSLVDIQRGRIEDPYGWVRRVL
jgi:branched-chain amino acid aminotransferase